MSVNTCWLSLTPAPAPARAQFQDRKVSHPLFKNVSQATAAEQLAREEPGACVFRPSVRGPVALGLTIKLHDGPDGQPLFYHTDLDESGKVRGLTLGVARGYIFNGVRLLVLLLPCASALLEDVSHPETAAEVINAGGLSCSCLLCHGAAESEWGYLCRHGGTTHMLRASRHAVHTPRLTLCGQVADASAIATDVNLCCNYRS